MLRAWLEAVLNLPFGSGTRTAAVAEFKVELKPEFEFELVLVFEFLLDLLFALFWFTLPAFPYTYIYINLY